MKASIPDDPDDFGQEYDLAAPPAPRPAIVVPTAPTPEPAANTASANSPATLPYRTRSQADAVDPEAIKNIWMPVWLLGGGVLVETTAAFVRGPDLHAAMTLIAFGLLAKTALMLVGLLIAAKLRQIDLGSLRMAAFKMAAVAIAPAAVATLVTPVLHFATFGIALPLPLIGGVSLGGLIALAIQFVLYFALLGALFDLDESDTWYCICVIFLVNLVAYFALQALDTGME